MCGLYVIIFKPRKTKPMLAPIFIMNYEEIKQKVTDREINCEQALESLAEIGYCPNLLNDDNGHWAVKFDGFKILKINPYLPMDDEPEDISTTCFIEAKDWKDSIYEALVWALS